MRDKIIIKTSIIGIIANIFLVIFKTIVGVLANSIAIVLDAVNNLSDCLSSIVTIVGTKLSSMRPDKKHPYGYGRIEYFTSLVVSLIIFAAGIACFRESILKIINVQHATYEWYSFLLVVTAIIVKYFLSNHYKKVGYKVNSSSLIASGEDAMNDAIISFSTLICAIISVLFGISLEGYVGLFISFVICKTAYEIMKESTGMILGSRADTELTDKIRKKINRFKEVQDVFDLNVHSYGPQKIFATAHIQVAYDTTAQDLCTLTRKIEYDIYNQYGIILTLGVYSDHANKYEEMEQEIKRIILEHTNVYKLHGFYVDERTKNVFFDIIFDFEVKDIENFKNHLIKDIKKTYPDYKYNIIIDSDFAE